MKHKLFYASVLSILMATFSASFNTLNAQQTQLPLPQKGSVKTSLMNALQNRHSVRSYKNKTISDQTLSNLLWAANGVNRNDGRRTAPSAINAQDIELYIGKLDGTYHYLASENKLEKVNNENFINIVVGRNKFALDAPIVILLVSNGANFRGHNPSLYGAMDAGYVSQNICLYCAADGLGTVPCAPKMDAAAIQKFLGVSTDYTPMIYHPIGYTEK